MDEMKVKLSSAFMKNMVAKALSRIIYKKFGYKIDIQIEDLGISMVDGETDAIANVRVKINNNEFKKIISDINKD